ncbi:MAG TPA: carboxyl transferase domain-containing protein [Solirubrobacterales bacterium]
MPEREGADPGSERDDLAELLARRALTEDAARPEAVERRHAAGGRTARENLVDLVDPGSFVEYGRYAIAAQRGRRELEDLIARTPADGLVGGTARVNGELFGERAACAVLSYDYTVLAGTQGALGHRKKDRLFELIERMRLPTVFFAEGGGGRPGDTDYPVVSALDTRAFALWARLSGLVPRIAVVHGRCFAGNAVIAGCSDLIVATENASLGMGGPAMIAGGGLGEVPPDEVGPIAMQAPNGVVDLVVADEAEATGLVRHASRLLLAGAALRVPLLAVILRRGYGLGAQAMTGGSLHEPLLTVAWPGAHLGPMGLEGAVRLALRKELAEIADEGEREQRVRDLTAQAERNAQALNAAALFELDDVIDPAETRALIASTLTAATAHGAPRDGRGYVDAW